MLLTEIRMPPPIRTGATLGVVSLASPVEPRKLTRGIRFLEASGYRVLVGAHVLAQQGYLAGTDDVRLDDFHDMLTHPQVTAVIAARGGYGSGRLLDRIQWRRLRDAQTAIIGYSDLTALQLGMLARTGLGSYYAPMVATDLCRRLPAAAAQSFTAALRGKRQRLAGVSWRNGRAEGPLIGGCLSVFASLLGTRFMPDLRGAILFLEDVEEQPYEVDRLLNQLRLAGIFRKVAGVAFGGFTRCRSRQADYAGPSTGRVLRELAASITAPVVGGLPFGHVRDKRTLPIGGWAVLDGAEGTLEC